MKNTALVWVIIFLSMFVAYTAFNKQEKPAEPISLTQYTQLADAKKIQGTVVDDNGTLKGKYMDESGALKDFTAEYMAPQAEVVFEAARKNGIEYKAQPSSGFWASFLMQAGFLILFILAWVFIMRQMSGGANKALSFGKSKARMMTPDDKKVTFKDVAGIDEAQEELGEVVEFLKDPEKFAKLGARIPKGLLLYGAPGTGKTLLARAIAGEAGVPFFSISGSDFVEMFVGVGASRVRDLFEQAKKNKPCVIFIDEIDAVGRHRWSGMGGGHDEREQTLNQLLVEMDGFTKNEGVILIAATNRPDMLDKALLRPGRFDRQITVDTPDRNGREQILKVHVRDVKIAADVDLQTVAKGTSGFTGADLANLVNEAALLTARRNKTEVTQAELEEARDRVMMGPERRSMTLSDLEKKLVAYHEAGHAVAAKFVDVDEEVHKITIIPRGRALGITSYLPGEERFTQFRQKLKDRMVYAMGGRVAEELIFGDFTTGASNDLMRITEMAKAMICNFGMSTALGMRTYGGDDIPIAGPMGKLTGGHANEYSDETAREIDAEISAIVNEAHARCVKILTDNRDGLDRVAQALLERESINGEELTLLLNNQTLPPLEEKNTPPAQPEPISTPTTTKNDNILGEPLA